MVELGGETCDRESGKGGRVRKKKKGKAGKAGKKGEKEVSASVPRRKRSLECSRGKGGEKKERRTRYEGIDDLVEGLRLERVGESVRGKTVSLVE